MPIQGSLYNDNSIADISAILRDVLAPYLGTFKNGQMAVWVEPPESPIPGSGLHCYIQRQPQQRTSSVYQWRITLTQYDKTSAGMIVLDNAIAAMRQRFPVRREIFQPVYLENEYPRFSFDLQFHREAYYRY